MPHSNPWLKPRPGEWRGWEAPDDIKPDDAWWHSKQYDRGRDSAASTHGNDSRGVRWNSVHDSGRGKGEAEQAIPSSKGRGRGKPCQDDFTPIVGNTLRFRSVRHAFYDNFPEGTKYDDETAPTEPIEVLEVRSAPITHWCKQWRTKVTRNFISVRFKGDDGVDYWTTYSSDGLAYMTMVDGDEPIQTGWFWS